MALKIDQDGWARPMRHLVSPNFDARPTAMPVSLVVLHNISLPPGQFEGGHVEQLFTNAVDASHHPFLAELIDARVSAHFVVARSGRATQFVSCEMRAWHAGVSEFRGVPRCNDYSVGIEIEGTDFAPFAQEQYETLDALLRALILRYPIDSIAGHSDIAPGRKTDPGPFFEWDRLRADAALASLVR